MDNLSWEATPTGHRTTSPGLEAYTLVRTPGRRFRVHTGHDEATPASRVGTKDLSLADAKEAAEAHYATAQEQQAVEGIKYLDLELAGGGTETVRPEPHVGFVEEVDRVWTDDGRWHEPKSFHPATCPGCTSDTSRFGQPHGKTPLRSEPHANATTLPRSDWRGLPEEVVVPVEVAAELVYQETMADLVLSEHEQIATSPSQMLKGAEQAGREAAKAVEQKVMADQPAPRRSFGKIQVAREVAPLLLGDRLHPFFDQHGRPVTSFLKSG